MRILDRYVLRNFLEPFFICFAGFIGILLIFDLYDNVPDFVEYHTPLHLVGYFYLTQLPAMVLWALPVGLLLSLLFSLSKMSRHNEIISMLTAGRSLTRVIAPLVVMGLLGTGVCFWLNSEWAPKADARKKQMLEEITRGGKRAADKLVLEGYLFRDRQQNRTWYVRKLKPQTWQLEGVHITQQDAAGNITRKWYADKATYDAAERSWKLRDGMIVDFDGEGDIATRDTFFGRDKPRVIKGWTETPWRIASSQLQAQNLSIAELHEYLTINYDFPVAQLAPFRTNLADRFAFPWSCLVLVFIAAPLGVVYNRRGVLGSVAGALTLFLGTILLRNLLLALGKGGRLEPHLAAWVPQVSFFLVGLVLLWFRSTNRDFPKLAFWR